MKKVMLVVAIFAFGLTLALVVNAQTPTSSTKNSEKVKAEQILTHNLASSVNLVKGNVCKHECKGNVCKHQCKGNVCKGDCKGNVCKRDCKSNDCKANCKNKKE